MTELQCVVSLVVFLLFLSLVVLTHGIHDQISRIRTILATVFRDELDERVNLLESKYETAGGWRDRRQIDKAIDRIWKAMAKD